MVSSFEIAEGFFILGCEVFRMTVRRFLPIVRGMKKLLPLIFFVLIGFSVAQKIVVSPQSIVINPLPTFSVEVFTDKDPSGSATPGYQIGEAISIGVRVSEASYVYVFNIKSTGEVQQILPNRYDADGQNNYLQAGETKYFPPRGARYAFNVDGPNGLDKVIAVASRSQLDTNQLASFNADPTFATSNIGETGFAQTFSIVVTPIPQNDWVTDTAIYYIGSLPSVPVFGSVSISSSPAGAEAYIDGGFVGYTPLTYGTRSGEYNIEVRLSGYQSYVTNVNVTGGQTSSVNASLIPIAVTPAPTPQPVPTPSGVVLFDYPYLLAYPGAVLTKLEVKSNKREAEFDIAGSVDVVYTYFHDQLQRDGWQRTELELRPQKAQARYERNGERFRLELQRRGESGKFKLEVRFSGGDDDDD